MMKVPTFNVDYYMGFVNGGPLKLIQNFQMPKFLANLSIKFAHFGSHLGNMRYFKVLLMELM